MASQKLAKKKVGKMENKKKVGKKLARKISQLPHSRISPPPLFYPEMAQGRLPRFKSPPFLADFLTVFYHFVG